MKKENISGEKRILYALGEADETYIAQAAPAEKAGSRALWMKWAALAACVTLTVYAGIRFLLAEHSGGGPSGLPGSSQNRNPSGLPGSAGDDAGGHTAEDGPSGLPMLTIVWDSGGSMGYEGCMAYDISDLTNANPWDETAQLSTLPVYRNTLQNETDFEAVENFLLETAKRLHMDTDTLKINDNTPDAEEQAIITEKFEGNVPEGYFDPTALVAEENGIKIEADNTMTVTITFEPAVPLPEKYRFTHDSSYEDTLAVAEYLQETYSDLINMEEPVINIYGGDYDIYRKQGYHITFFDAAESLTERILNYQFFQTAFYCDDEGRLNMARIYRPDLSDKAGDYPIISKEEATDLLLNGNYITSVPFEMPGEKYIAKAELVYRSGKNEKYYMPYYRFYAELPEMEQEDGLKDYGAYYVPAVQKEYLTDMPVWNGDFN